MSNKTKGILYIITAAFFFALMNTFVRLSGDLPPMQKSFFRNFIAFFVALFLLLRTEEKFSFKKENLPFFIFRAFFGTIGIFCNYYAIDHLLLSDATMLNKLSPFFAVIASYFILKERLSLSQALCIIIAFIGSLFIIKPGAGGLSASFPSFIGLIGGICAGTAYTFVRLLSKKGERGPFIVFFFSGFSCLASIPFFAFNFHPMTLFQIIYLICAGLAAAAAQFAITAAYSNAAASEISIYDYTQVIFSALLGFILFSQVPDMYSILGYIIICSVSMFNFIKANKKTRIYMKKA
ncbi:DMT family transporter [Anaerotignum faecicola]|nr:DMT family transporter [Anaerotignum faecicola]